MRRGLGILLALLAAVVVFAPAADAVGLSGTKARLKRAMNAAGKNSGALVVDMDTGETLLSRHSTNAFVPASVNKLYTTSTALLKFGADGRLATDVLADAEPDDSGVVQGDLYLHGGGDPTLDTKQLVQLAQATAKKTNEITGDLVGDESFFDNVRGVPSSNFNVSRYVGPLSALTWHYGYDGNKFQKDTALRAAKEFAKALKGAGVKLDGKVHTGTAPVDSTTIAEHFSPTIAELAQQTNRPSNNFFAETLLKDIGAAHGTTGSTAAGAAIVKQTAADLGISPTIVDGSGLSRTDHTTPQQLVKLLRAMADKPEYGAFYASLPVIGRNGTMANRMKGTAAQDRCVAKTGTLNSVSTLAGYCATAGGSHRIAFAIMENDISPSYAHGVQDKLVETIAGYN